MVDTSSSPGEPRGGLVERIAGWSARRRGLAIIVWFGLVVASVLLSAVVSGKDASNFDAGESGQAQRVMREQNTFEPIKENVLVQPLREGGDQRLATDPALRSAVDDLADTLRGMPDEVGAVRSPFDDDGADLVSADGRSGLLTFQFSGAAEKVRGNYNAVVKAIDDTRSRHPDVRIAQAGDRSLSTAVDDYITSDLVQSHVLSLPVTLLILLVVFGSLVAAGIPLLLTITVVAATFSLLTVVGKFLPVNSAASAMILLIGIAVGVDYSLFYLRRHREERLAGRDVKDSLRITARTSGHVVVVSGLTVMLCLCGLLFTGLGVFQGLTMGTILVVGLAMVASVTVLPALLSLLGPRIDKLRIPWLGRGRTTAHESRTWARVANAVVRRPLVWGGGAVLILVFVALPTFSMHLQDPAATDSLPRSVPAVDAAVRMQEAFPGAPTPARVVLWDESGGQVDTPALRAAIDDFRAEAATMPEAFGKPITSVRVDQAVVLRVPLAGGGTDPTSNRALETLRNTVLSDSFDRVDGVGYAVGGRTASPYDFAQQLGSRTLFVFVFVLVLAFLLLLWAFRSITIPIVSIVLNLLSIGAACGLVTWVFQYGNLSSLLGFSSYGGVVEWLPLFMFVMLFGLSMDYHIFILSRVRERWLAGSDPRRSVTDGIAASAGVVTSAAVVMTAVFAVFVTLTAIEYKMLGVGMAFAVIVDATIVRGVLLPAAMALLGDHAWTLPKWLRWLPGRAEDRRAGGSPAQAMTRALAR
jgi:RND superfamily putative drug exporter